MSAKVFLDTNVLIYAAAGDQVHPGKFAKTGEILTTEIFAISTQWSANSSPMCRTQEK